MKCAGGTSTRGLPMPAMRSVRVADPAAPGDVVVEPRVAVDEDVDAGAVLRRHVAGKAVEVLLAIGELRKAVRQRCAAQIGGVPGRPRQRAGGGGEQGLALGGGEHRDALRGCLRAGAGFIAAMIDPAAPV
jgi:hypothetical protein